MLGLRGNLNSAHLIVSASGSFKEALAHAGNVRTVQGYEPTSIGVRFPTATASRDQSS